MNQNPNGKDQAMASGSSRSLIFENGRKNNQYGEIKQLECSTSRLWLLILL